MNSHTFESALDDLELRLDRLRTLYEQFVGGREDVDPVGLESDIARRLARLEEGLPPGTHDSTRLTLLRERHASFKRYWERLPRRMNQERALTGGEVPPSSAAVERGQGRRSVPTPPLGTPALVAPWGDGTNAARSIRPARVLALAEYAPAVVQPEDSPTSVHELRQAFEDDLETLPRYHVDAPKPTVASRISPEQVRAIHERLVAATADDTRPVTLEKLTQTLRETELRLRERYGERSITFEVVLKQGRPVIKPFVR